MINRISLNFIAVFFVLVTYAQDDLEDMLNEIAPLPEQEAMATFKSGRVINLHTNERVAAGSLELRISHRFGRLNGGAYELWGLDQSTIRIGLDYGINDRLNI